MRIPNPTPIKRTAIAAVVVAALLTAAGSAAAGTYALKLTTRSAAVAGRPMLLRAAGVTPPPAEWWSASWLSVVAIPARVVSQCPVSALDGSQVAPNTGGQILAIALTPNLDPAGNFANLVGFTPWARGRYRICAYLDDGAGATLARAALTVKARAPRARR